MSLSEKINLSNDLRIQGVVHGLCLYIFVVKRYLNIHLPYPIYLSHKGGFMIRHEGRQLDLPLFLLPQSKEGEWGTENTNWYIVEEFLEQGLILLNANINFINRYVGSTQFIGLQFENHCG